MSPDALQVMERVVAVTVETSKFLTRPSTETVIVLATIKFPGKYGERKLEVHMYSPASLGLSGLNERVPSGSRDTPSRPPTLSH
jgi:hypothetical protein